MFYLLHSLLQKGKPTLWYTINWWYLFCSKGVYAIPQKELTANILMDEDWKGVYFLADANSDGALNDIFYFSDPYTWTLIYASSPEDVDVTEALRSNFSSRYMVFVMNPWTLFDMELV